jgi:hypothetical protein
MEMIIGVVADATMGGTFLTWSLHYLAGHSTYFSAKEKNYINLIDDPLTNINAHKFRPNQPNDLIQFDQYIDLIINTPTELFHSIYFHQLRPTNGILDQTDTTTAVKKIQATHTTKLIVLNNGQDHALYNSKFEGRVLRSKFGSASDTNKNFDDQLSDFVNTFFKDSKIAWGNLNLDNVWEYREFLALNLRPRKQPNIISSVDLTRSHYRIDSFDLFQKFDSTVKSLFAYLDISIDSSRWNNWLQIYRKWQTFHLDRILFVEYFDVIITSIINNYYLDLSRFELDLVREAVIQHELIYKHRLTIKGWGLEQFPNNTQDLHKLLEPNIHQIDDIYNCL